MTVCDKVVFLFDVDNTLLDNDRVENDLNNHLEHEFGAESRDRYWVIFEELRAEMGYADCLGALQRYRLEDMCDTRLLLMSSFLMDYPFSKRVYPCSIEAIENIRYLGQNSHSVSCKALCYGGRQTEHSGSHEKCLEGKANDYFYPPGTLCS